jgi:hypothetical protein
VLLIQSHSEVLDAWRDFPAERRRLWILLLDKKGDFGVSFPKETAVVDVSTANDHALVIHDHQFGVDVEDLRKREFFLSGPMLPEAVELQVILNVLDVRQSLV